MNSIAGRPRQFVMTDARAIPDAVLWHEGMLLSPQHFQEAERRAHALRSYLVGAVAPFGWGVRRLTIDTAAFEAGRFCVTELEALMPDGLLITHPAAANDRRPELELDLKPLLAQGEVQALTVHLAVARQESIGGPSGPGKRRRFRQIDGSEIADANTGDSAIVIPRLLPNPVLETTYNPVDPPSPAHVVSMPLMVLLSNGQRFIKSEDYEPPRLFIEEGAGLLDCARTVEAGLSAKARDWAARLHGAISGGQADVVRDSVVTLRTIVRGLPRLSALLKTQLADPFNVYLALCDIAGELAVMGGELTAPDFETYRHENPLLAFRTVAQFISDALDKLRTPYTIEIFEQPAAGSFKLKLRKELLRDDQVVRYLRGRLVIGVHMKRTQSADAVREWLSAARIGDEKQIASLDLNRSRGAEREETQSAPDLGVLPQMQTLLYYLRTDDPDLLIGGRTLEIRLAPDQAPVDTSGGGSSEPDQIVLFVPAPDSNIGTSRA